MKNKYRLFHTGIPLIDKQHAQYMNLVDELCERCRQSDAKQKVLDRDLRKVLSYAIEHFDAEESLMRNYKYPGYKKHREKHDEFRNEADRILIIDRKTVAPSNHLSHLTKWLIGWFCEQTLVYDSGLAAFMMKRQKKST